MTTLNRFLVLTCCCVDPWTLPLNEFEVYQKENQMIVQIKIGLPKYSWHVLISEASKTAQVVENYKKSVVQRAKRLLFLWCLGWPDTPWCTILALHAQRHKRWGGVDAGQATRKCVCLLHSEWWIWLLPIGTEVMFCKNWYHFDHLLTDCLGFSWSPHNGRKCWNEWCSC